jgi:hypothetical protein
VSFVWKAPQRLKTPEQVAKECLEVALARGLDEFAAVLAVMCIAQESDFWCPANEKDPTSKNYPHDSLSDDGRSVAYFQQQNGVAGENPPANQNWWGPMSQRMDLKQSCNEFLSRLEDNYRDAINNPAEASRRFIQNVQRSAYPDAYAKHWDRAWLLVRGAGGQPAEEKPVGWTGDPVWLEDVLRPALGNRLKTLDGWQNSGHGDFADIRGVMVHHTGNSRETAQSIRNGRPDLEGPLSNLHIAPDGTVTIVAVGVCWHAGRGSYPWLPTDNANQHMIGIECAWPDIAANGSYNPAQLWPDAQIISMRDTCAALVKKLELPATRVIGHKEYAGAAQGKWDPGNIDMSWFRGEVAKDMRGEFDKGQPSPQPGPVLPPNYEKEVWDQLRIQWPQLGGRTLVDTVAAIGAKLGVEGCYDPKAKQ